MSTPTNTCIDAIPNMDDGSTPEISYGTSTVVQVLVSHLGPVLLVGGLVGNILAAIVVTRSKILWRRTTSLYILVLSGVDSITLLLGLGDYLLYVNGIKLRSMSHVACKSLIFRFYFLKMLEAWVLVNMNLERLVAVYVPHRVKLLFTKRRAGLGLLLTTLVVLTLNIVYILTFELAEEDYCVVKVEYKRLMVIWYWIDLCLASVIPFLIMAGCSVAIVTSLVRAKQQWGHGQNMAYAKISNLTVTMLLVALCFLILTAPLTVLSPMISIYHEHKTDFESSKYFDVFHLLNVFLYCNYVLNFYIYCVSHPKFRQEFCVVICKQNHHDQYSIAINNRRSQTTQSSVPTSLVDEYQGTHL